jgi:hypothetical protein
MGKYSTANQIKVLGELPDGIILADSENIRYMNEEAFKLLKVRPCDYGKPIEEVMCVEKN